MNKAQGTIEYLVIIAIIIVIALVVVGLLVNFISPIDNTSESAGQIGSLTREISLIESSVTTDGSYLLS